MSKKRVIAIVASILLVGVPFMVQAAQITPNPNPEGSTIDIINDPFGENTANPFVNAGTLTIDSLSTLTNAGTLMNASTYPYNAVVTLTNTDTLNQRRHAQELWLLAGLQRCRRNHLYKWQQALEAHGETAFLAKGI